MSNEKTELQNRVDALGLTLKNFENIGADFEIKLLEEIILDISLMVSTTKDAVDVLSSYKGADMSYDDSESWKRSHSIKETVTIDLIRNITQFSY